MIAKISFGFKKSPKKSAVIGAKVPEAEKVELVKCVDSNCIKLIDELEEEEKPLLVIPLLGQNKKLPDRIKDAIDLKERSRIRFEEKNNEEIDNRPDSELTIEELAARKLIQEAETYTSKTTAPKVRSIPIEDQLILEGAAEPTQDDYDAVPISEYGYAMLRGMGWNEHLSTKKAEAPDVRPKGMGLGASVCGGKPIRIPKDKQGNDLRLVKGAKAKVIAGKEQGNYGIVQGLDDDAGRIIMRMTLTGAIVSLHEFLLLPVTHEEYAQCANVLNNRKFEKYKKKGTHSKQKPEIKQERNDTNSEVEYVPNNSRPEVISSDSEAERNEVKSRNKVALKQEHKRSKSKSSRVRRSRSRSENASRSSQESEEECDRHERKRHQKKSKSKKKRKHAKEQKKHKKRSRHRHRNETDSNSTSDDSSR